jgi:hypothetical protein
MGMLLWRSTASSSILCELTTFGEARCASMSESSDAFFFSATAIGSCHNRASTSCSATISSGFSAGAVGRLLTSGLYCAIMPASAATKGSSVAPGYLKLRFVAFRHGGNLRPKRIANYGHIMRTRRDDKQILRRGVHCVWRRNSEAACGSYNQPLARRGSRANRESQPLD